METPLCARCLVAVFDSSALIVLTDPSTDRPRSLEVRGPEAVDVISRTVDAGGQLAINQRPAGWISDTVVNGTAVCRWHARPDVTW